MFKVNLAVVAEMTKMERLNVEEMYLNLAYAYETEEIISGSRAMRRSPEEIVMQGGSYSFAERQAVRSFKELFDISSENYKRTGLQLISFVPKEEKTPENALNTWHALYKKIDALKASNRVAL